jgi:ABC-type dipeptide/oligopeptide/nickel transport system ATPase component
MRGKAMAEIIRYDQVDICYGGRKVIDHVSFSARQGEILGIVGESGSGKSTLIKAAMGLLGNDGLVTRGDIWYNGLDLPDLSPAKMRMICGSKIGMIFQMAGSSFCPIRTVRTQLYEMMTEHEKLTEAEFKDLAEGLFRKFGFHDPKRVLDAYPFELSGGMQQRVGIAAAMLLNPEILMADEPTSALDVSVQKQVVEEMLMVRENFGTTILLVTHNLGVIRAMSDSMLVLKDGKMAEYGETKRVLADPQSEYTRRLLSAVPVLRR